MQIESSFLAILRLGEGRISAMGARQDLFDGVRSKSRKLTEFRESASARREERPCFSWDPNGGIRGKTYAVSADQSFVSSTESRESAATAPSGSGVCSLRVRIRSGGALQ
jgi:hypothetical protein